MPVADIVKAAAVSCNAFYKNFADKQECLRCDAGATIEERVQRSLAAGLDAMGKGRKGKQGSKGRRRP